MEKLSHRQSGGEVGCEWNLNWGSVVLESMDSSTVFYSSEWKKCGFVLNFRWLTPNPVSFPLNQTAFWTSLKGQYISPKSSERELSCNTCQDELNRWPSSLPARYNLTRGPHTRILTNKYVDENVMVSGSLQINQVSCTWVTSSSRIISTHREVGYSSGLNARLRWQTWLHISVLPFAGVGPPSHCFIPLNLSFLL